MLGCTASTTEHTEAPAPDAAPGTFPEDEPEPTYDDGPRHIYLHGYVTSRLMKLPSTSNTTNGGSSEKPKGVPICIAASHVDGIVLALTPFHNSNNYRSAVVHGWASIVESEEERMHAMHLITDNVLAHRWNNSRVPPTKAELTSTGILKVEIASASAKVRVGGPGDDRPDLKNESVIGNTWTGVLPVYLQYGDPVASDYNRVAKVPSYIAGWVKDQNEKNKQGALKAMIDPTKASKE